MKKLFAILIICVVVGSIYFFVRARGSGKQNVQQQNEGQTVVKNIPETQPTNPQIENPAAEPVAPTLVAVKPVVPPVLVLVDASQKPPANKPITHTATDF